MMRLSRLSHEHATTEEDASEKAGEKMSEQYHLIVEEIKKENRVWGSLQLHSEAMQRLKQRQAGANAGEDVPRPEPKLRKKMNLARSLIRASHMKWGDFSDFGRRISSDSQMRGDNDASHQIMPGRRESNRRGLQMGFDDAVISAARFAREDLELSDSEDDEASLDSFSSPSEQKLGEVGGGRRCSKLGGGGGGSRRKSLIRRSSSIRSQNGSDGRQSSTLRRSGSKNIKLPGLIRRKNSRRSSSSTVSFDAAAAQKSSEEHKLNGVEGKLTESWDELKDEKPNPIISEGYELSDKAVEQAPIIPKRARPRGRTGRRRSSLFSLDERRASIQDRSSNGSVDNSTSEESRNGSLICSFGRNSLTDSIASKDGGSLICTWGRMQSDLSNSGISIHEEDLLNGHEDNQPPSSALHESNNTLICGWDPSQSESNLSISDEELLKRGRRESRKSLTILSNSSLSITEDLNLEEGDEKALLQIKEACTLFDIRQSEVV